MLSDYIEERYGAIIRNHEIQHQKDQEQQKKYEEQHLKDQIKQQKYEEEIKKYKNMLKDAGIIVD